LIYVDSDLRDEVIPPSTQMVEKVISSQSSAPPLKLEGGWIERPPPKGTLFAKNSKGSRVKHFRPAPGFTLGKPAPFKLDEDSCISSVFEYSYSLRIP